MIRGQFGDQDDRRKVFHRVVGQVGVDMRADAVGRDRIQQQRVAIGVGLGDGRSRGRAAGAAAIADEDGLPKRVGELCPDDPGNEVGGAAGRDGDDELNGTARIAGLRMRGAFLSEDKRRHSE
jgi:hypothetical protein